MVSWGILWSAFFLASIVAAWQVWKENKMLKARREADVEQAAEGVSSADITRSMVRQSNYTWELRGTCISLTVSFYCYSSEDYFFWQ